MHTSLLLSFLLCLAVPIAGLAQQDSIPPPPADSITLPLDSLASLPQNDIKTSAALKAEVSKSAEDSMIIDNLNKQFILYGNAIVSYQDITLKANYIALNWESNIVTASGYPDSSGVMTGYPEFTQGEQNFKADSIRYNFNSRKGIVYQVKTEQNDVIVHGSRTKFVQGEPNDTTDHDILFSEGTILTTCTLDHPHFGIRSNKQKVIPNKMVIIGPSQLEVMGIPTPVWLPFGFFPIKSGRSTGLLFPRDYEYSQQWGFGLRDVGWFFPLGDHYNLSLRSNIYLKGTWGLSADVQYRKRYKHNGSFSAGFDSRKVENLSDASFSRNQSFRLLWSHNQDAAAHPTNRFGGSINIQTNNYQSTVFNDASNVLPTQLTSNMTFNKTFQTIPASLSASFNHSQNTSTRDVTINFPNVRFLTQSIYPFKNNKKGGNKDKWYETIVMRYTGEAKNRFQAADTTLFTQKTLDDAQFGVRHDVSLNNTLKVLKYFNLNPNISYKEVWHWKSIRQDFDPMLDIAIDTVYNADSTAFTLVRDTLDYGNVTIDTLQGFESWRQFTAGISLNTQIYGTVQFKKGLIRGLRHEIRPSISLNFSPDYLDPDLGYYREVQNDIRFPEDTETYSIFQGNIFGSPPRSGQAMSLNYSLNNIFQAKVFSKRDSTEKKIKLIDNLIVSGNYNFAADSLQWSTVNVRTTMRLFKGMTTVGFSSVFDPYEENASGRRINQLVGWDNGLPVRFESASLRIATNLTVGKIRALFQGKEEEVVTDVNDRRRQQRERQKETDFLSLFENFSISHNIGFTWQASDGKTEMTTTSNSINCRGSIDLTDNWGINVGNFGYDFKNNGLSYPSVGFRRDLHCWEMSMDWQPTRGTYRFSVRVKPGTLDFIKVPYQRNNADAQNAFN